MINDTIAGIVNAISTVYGDEFVKYKDEQEQLNKPCFLIKPVKYTQEHHIQNRYIRTEVFDISYYSNDKAFTYEYMNVLESLFAILEYINIGENLTRGTDMSSEIADGVLHFHVTYKVFVVKEYDKEDNMEEYSTNMGLKKA